MADDSIRIVFDRSPPEYVGGEWLTAQVETLDTEAAGGEWQIVWHTEGKGDEDVAAAAQGVIASLGSGLPSTPISVRLPIGPWSYDGQIVKICWSFQVKVKCGLRIREAAEGFVLRARGLTTERRWRDSSPDQEEGA